MAEEIRGANVVIPWCIVSTTLLNGILGFVIVVVVMFVTVDIDSALASPTGLLGCRFSPEPPVLHGKSYERSIADSNRSPVHANLCRCHRLPPRGFGNDLHYHHHGYLRWNCLPSHLIPHCLGVRSGPRPPLLADHE